ncbi:MAG: BglII/BstYI family type II restriction endonuclease, partial [Candidatus Thorarchaeota archaeon]
MPSEFVIKLILNTENYRYADQVLNSKLEIKDQFLDSLRNFQLPPGGISRPGLNKAIEEHLTGEGWESQVPVFGTKGRGETRLDFLRNRVGVEVQFGHASFVGIDLLKFQVASYSGLDMIDAGIYVMATR